jgi:hypothetical protein
MIHPVLANWIVGAVAVVWVVNFVATLVPALNYKPDPLIHAPFMFIVGGALALKRDKKDNTGEKDGH